MQNSAQSDDNRQQLSKLVSLKIIGLYVRLRRSGLLAQKRKFGLSELEWVIMTQVGSQAPLSLNGLAELTVMDRGQLSRAVKALANRGLLSRKRQPGGPEIRIELAPEGKELHAKMSQWAIQRDEKLTKDIPAENLATLWELITLMNERADDMLKEERELLLQGAPPEA